MMKCEYLNWDSDFFGRRIGRVIVDEAVDEAELANMLKEWGKEYDLLYVFSSKPLTNAASILGMKLVDEKVVIDINVIKSCADFGFFLKTCKIKISNLATENVTKCAWTEKPPNILFAS